ncbi:MAG: ABC transporter substrate-binding protein [Propionibacterium sp.]|nr:ABC transporter substrate-binding protein [Propionibacterium sp.]
MRKSIKVLGVALVSALALTACSDDAGDGETLVVGSQDYYSNEIVAEVYAQALEDAGFTVERDFRIGQREVYLPELEAGNIDVFPEYTGNLLQYYSPDTEATAADDVYAELASALPEGLRALDQSDASDQDSFVVTSDFASEHGLTGIGDLAVVDDVTLGGNSELETRPYGPQGLESVYGVTVAFTPIEDSGGPLTVKALRDGDVQVVNIYTADPVLADGDLVVLDDPEGLLLASHVVPLASDRVTDEAADVINAVSGAMSAEDLVELNSISVTEESPAATIAADWLAEQNL